MAKLFQGEVRAKGQPDSLMTERKPSGRISVSAMFKVEPGEKAEDDRGRQTEVGGTMLSAYLTVTEKTRQRVIVSLVHCGMSEEVAKRVIESAEEGQLGKIPARYGFGSKVCQLNCKIETYEGKTSTRVQWINGEGGGRRGKDAPEVDLGIAEPRKSNSNGQAQQKKERAPWETA